MNGDIMCSGDVHDTLRGGTIKGAMLISPSIFKGEAKGNFKTFAGESWPVWNCTKN